MKTVWDDSGIEKYEAAIGSSLRSIRELWGNNQSRSSISILLSSTYACLSLAATSTNKTFPLGVIHRPKPHISLSIKSKENATPKAKKILDRIFSSAPSPLAVQEAQDKLSSCRSELKQAVRAENAQLRQERGEKFFSILSSDPSSAIRSIKTNRNSAGPAVHRLTVQ